MKQLITIDDVVQHLNDGIKRSDDELYACKKFLIEFQAANDLSLNELDDMCFRDSNWFFENIFN